MCPISPAGGLARDVARASGDAQRSKSGDRRGRLFVVGIGPGSQEYLTPAAASALQAADVVVGYKPYLVHVAGLLGDARVLASGMGAEAARAAAAIEAARDGETVAVVSSGDAGVYGMAALVLEMLAPASAPAPAPTPVDVEVVPGITAALAAAAVLGAPLTNDFACISLSDLLTPLSTIERRLRAVSAADLALALYNPRSHTRTAPLDLALGILRADRAPETLVGSVRNACREDQAAHITTLAELDPAAIDMFTVVIVGDSTTRLVGGRMVTPRGYGL